MADLIVPNDTENIKFPASFNKVFIKQIVAYEMFYSVSAIAEKFLQHFKSQPAKQMSEVQATSYEHANIPIY